MKWHAEKRNIEDLKPFEKNPREIGGEKYEQLKDSLDEFGLAEPLVINTDDTIIGGHARWYAMKEKGVKEVDVFVPEEKLSHAQMKELNIRLNKNIAGEWDFDTLANHFDVDDLKDWGFTEDELQVFDEPATYEEEGIDKDLKDIKILNLYAGIGGNRKFWGDVDVTAVEYDDNIASIYQDFFPNDEVIVADAHEYLEKHFDEYDFIWTSPPCPTHSRMKPLQVKSDHKINESRKAEYPDMRLYQEILLLEHFFEGKWCVENVQSYYEPLIEPQEVYRHYFWTNFDINTDVEIDTIDTMHSNAEKLAEHYQFDIDFSKYDTTGLDDAQLVRNCVHPKVGEQILKSAYGKET